MGKSDLFAPDEPISEDRVNEIIDSKDFINETELDNKLLPYQKRCNESYNDTTSHTKALIKTHAYLVFFSQAVSFVNYQSGSWNATALVGSQPITFSGNNMTYGSSSGATDISKGVIDLSI